MSITVSVHLNSSFGNYVKPSARLFVNSHPFVSIDLGRGCTLYLDPADLRQLADDLASCADELESEMQSSVLSDLAQVGL